MIVEKQKARATLLLRRKRAIIASLIVFAALIAVWVIISPYLNTTTITDADGVSYKIKFKQGVYSLYDARDVEITRESEYNYYVTENGTLIDLDNATGSYKIIAVPDTESGEAIGGTQNNVLIFPSIEKKNIFSIEAHNPSGDVTFIRYNVLNNKPDPAADFIIEGAPLTPYDQEAFAEFYVSAGYPLTSQKISAPIKDERGEFSEYGLVSETRVNAEGEEYLYTPAYYVITDVEGNKHKLIIGDMLVSGTGYYVQYVALNGERETKRDAVYVYSAAMAEPLLMSAKQLASPTIVQDINMNNYFDVQNFDLYRYDEEGNEENVVGFTFSDLESRNLTVYASKPFVFDNEALKLFTPNDDIIFDALSNFYNTEFQGIAALIPTDDDFVTYGLAKYVTDEEGNTDIKLTPTYAIRFESDLYDTGNPIVQHLLISKKNEAGNYYVFTIFYDANSGELLFDTNMIAEVKGHCLDFVEYDATKWTRSTYFDTNIAFCDTLKVETERYSATFKLDNSASDMSQKIDSSGIKISASDSEGNDIDAFSSLTVTDTQGFVWTITPAGIAVYNSKGQAAQIASGYYSENTLGRSVLSVSGYINCIDGRKVRVSPDEVSVEYPDGSTETYARFATQLFRLYYQTLLSATVIDSYKMSAEEEAELLADDSRKLLTLTLTRSENAYGKDGEGLDFPEDFTITYEFYRLTSRKAYIVVDGIGGFYGSIDRVSKIVADAERFFALEPINATAQD